MEALLCRKLGDPTLDSDDPNCPLVYVKDHPIPELDSSTAVRVKITASSVNFGNYTEILGKYNYSPPLPFIPGADYSGVVDAIGPDVSKFRVGDSVCGFAFCGSYAQFIVEDESRLIKVPEGCDMVAAAALPIAFGTSHVALVHRAHLAPHQVLLVLGAAGGVGLAAVQIGKVCGAIVIAVSSGVEKVKYLKSLGVDHVVDLSCQTVIEGVEAFLKERNLKGVDVLYDPVGGKLAEETLKLLNWGAHILIIGFASGENPVIATDVILAKNWTVHGLFWGSYTTHNPRVLEDSLMALLSWMKRGLIDIHISHTYNLSEARLAFSVFKERKVIGKVMLVLDDKKKIRPADSN